MPVVPGAGRIAAVVGLEAPGGQQVNQVGGGGGLTCCIVFASMHSKHASNDVCGSCGGGASVCQGRVIMQLSHLDETTG